MELDSPVVINVAGPHSAQACVSMLPRSLSLLRVRAQLRLGRQLEVTKLAFPDPAENDMIISTKPMRQALQLQTLSGRFPVALAVNRESLRQRSLICGCQNALCVLAASWFRKWHT